MSWRLSGRGRGGCCVCGRMSRGIGGRGRAGGGLGGTVRRGSGRRARGRRNNGPRDGWRSRGRGRRRGDDRRARRGCGGGGARHGCAARCRRSRLRWAARTHEGRDDVHVVEIDVVVVIDVSVGTAQSGLRILPETLADDGQVDGRHHPIPIDVWVHRCASRRRARAQYENPYEARELRDTSKPRHEHGNNMVAHGGRLGHRPPSSHRVFPHILAGWRPHRTRVRRNSSCTCTGKSAQPPSRPRRSAMRAPSSARERIPSLS